MISDNLNHQLEEGIDLVLPVAEVTTLNKVVSLLPPSASGVVQLEGPQEVGGVLEVGADSQNLVDQILHADDAHLAELSLDDVVGGDGGAVTINLENYSHRDTNFYRPEHFMMMHSIGNVSDCFRTKIQLEMNSVG